MAIYMIWHLFTEHENRICSLQRFSPEREHLNFISNIVNCMYPLYRVEYCVELYLLCMLVATNSIV
jgi:hypothetical protein